MSHPYESYRENKVSDRRVGTLTKGYASGGAVSDEASDRKAIASAVHKHEKHMHGGEKETRLASGGAARHRPDHRAKGGRVKSKGTHVNVIVAPQGQQGATPVPVPVPAAGGAPPMPPRPPMPAPGMAPAAGMIPPGGGSGGMPPMPMRKAGGRVRRDDGGVVKYPNKVKGLTDQEVEENERRRPPGGPYPQLPSPRATGGRVGTGVWEEGVRNGTQVSHRTKNDLDKINTSPPLLTRARGGPIEASNARGPKMHAGADSGEGRLERTALQKRSKLP